MLGAKNSLKIAVLHRIDDLENSRLRYDLSCTVLHRIDDLEKSVLRGFVAQTYL